MIRPQMRVENFKTGKLGTTAPDLPGMMSCNGPGEITVVYDGTTVGEGTNETSLRVLGPENAIADLVKCGAGQGEQCCIFLTVGGAGASCERHSSLRWNLIFKNMAAKRNPAEPYPACQKFNGANSKIPTKEGTGP